MNLNDMVIDLANARAEEARAKEVLDQIIAELELRPDYANALAARAAAQKKSAYIDEAIRESAIEIYNHEGEKHPHPAVSIAVSTKLEYDKYDALLYAREYAKFLVVPESLNEKGFEKWCKTGYGDYTPAFVKVIEEPTARISTDLTGYVL
jgi:hypothetical protein